MAGHSKWANIQHRKNAQDAKRGKIFTKLIREITVAARAGGADPSANPRLRLVVDKALSNNMSRDTIDKAIKRGVGDVDSSQMEEIRYEGYGPGGVAVLVECLSDNRNRTVSEVRAAFKKKGGSLGTDGSVAYLFSQRGCLSFAPGASEDHILDVALDAGAEDVIKYADESIDVITAPDQFSRIKDVLSAAKLVPAQAAITMIASTEVAIDDVEIAESVLSLIDALEDLDDVQEVFTNADIQVAL